MFKLKQPLMNFDNGAGFGGGDVGSNFQVPATTSVEANQAPQPTITNPLLDPSFMNPAPAAPAIPQETLDFAGRKVPVVDPILKDIHKDYSELNRTYQTTNQRVRELEQMNQQYQQMMQQFQAQQLQAQQAPAAPDPVDLEARKEAFMEKWYDNPEATFQEYVNSLVNPLIQPITQEKQFQQDVQTMEQRYADFRDVMPAMRDLLADMPHLGDQGLETLYLVAKGKTAQMAPAAPAPTAEQLMQDPAFIQQIMQNEQVRNQVVQQYMSQRQQTNQQIPFVMGSQPGGQAPSVPEDRPQSIREASKMFLKSMGL